MHRPLPLTPAGTALQRTRDLPGPLATPLPAAADRSQDALTCPHGPAPCAALVHLLGQPRAESDEAQAWVAQLRPCASCRVASEAGREGLRGLRLGQREREVLLGAARQDVFVVTAPGMLRAVSAARRRAAQTLARAGLVAPAPKCESGGGPAIPRLHPRAAVALTPMGKYVLAAFGRYIEAGRPVRWTRPRAGVPVPGKEPFELVEEALELTRRELGQTLIELKRVLIAAVGRPVRDPALLDAVTRHLQMKAQGLRDLLEPKGSNILRRRG